MTNQNGSQIGRSDPAEPAYEFSRRWEDIPLPVLREFVARLAAKFKYAGVGRMLGLSKETVRRFELGLGDAERSTVRKIALHYLEQHPAGYVAERKLPDEEREPVPQLKMVLPEGEEAARAYVRRMIELAESRPDLFPDPPGQLRWWLETVLAAEYAAEAKYELQKRQRRRKGEGGRRKG